MKWEYEPTQLNGGAPGDAFKSIFNGSGKSHSETLAREAIQNSVDAAKMPSGSVRVDFRFTALVGDARRRFEDVAALPELRLREPKLGLLSDNALARTERPIGLLYIDDYETTGLQGDPTSPSSNLRKLLMDLGGSGKARLEDPSGGSYGFGKAVYSSTSRIGTIFAYSRTLDAEGREISVLMGCAYHEGHEIDGESCTGRAFFGMPTKIEGRGVRYDPFLGEHAEALASELGFDREDGLGTSILIVDAGVIPADVVSGIENWWWPRLVAGTLDASVIDYDGNELFPQPKKRAHLKPFIDSYFCARGQTPPLSGKLDRQEFNRIGSTKIGVLGLTVVDDSEEENPFGEEYEQRLDTVALVRSPLMVVDYHSKWRSSKVGPIVVGCFVADNDIDYVLKLSEPPDHSRWDPSADRLQKHDAQASELVEAVLRRIKSNYKRFQDAAKPPAPPRPKRLEKLERALASWFGVGPKGGKPGPDPNPAPISLRPDDLSLSMENGLLRAKGGAEIRLSDKNGEAQWVRVKLELRVAEEDGISAADPIPISVTSTSRIEPLDEASWLCRVEGEDPVRFDFLSDPYDPEWTVQFLPEVMPVDKMERAA